MRILETSNPDPLAVEERSDRANLSKKLTLKKYLECFSEVVVTSVQGLNTKEGQDKGTLILMTNNKKWILCSL